ncbi:MAG TPA: cell division protein ZapA [Crocinitomix sp.]|nr:cell division protein ZapA [Crocinitomix sp.]
MEKVSLKVIIAGRTYPLTIKKEEKSTVLNAAEKINSNIKKLQGSYAVKDMQDLLAMTALQLAIQNNSKPVAQTQSIDSTVIKDLSRIIGKINEQL